MAIFEGVVGLIGEVLQLDEIVIKLQQESPLLGAIPEFDSMAVVTLLTAIEEEYDIMIDDDEVDADIFETVGSLVQFVEQKI